MLVSVSVSSYINRNTGYYGSVLVYDFEFFDKFVRVPFHHPARDEAATEEQFCNGACWCHGLVTGVVAWEFVDVVCC